MNGIPFAAALGGSPRPSIQPYESSTDSEAGDTPTGQIACPTCMSTYLGEAAYIAHLRAAHAQQAEDLSLFQLDIPQRLLFCPHCHLICRAPVASLAIAIAALSVPPLPCSLAPAPSQTLSPGAIAAAAERDLLSLISHGLHSPHRA